MDQATITRVVSDAQHANSLPEIKRALENLALVVSMLAVRIEQVRDNQRKEGTRQAILTGLDRRR